MREEPFTVQRISANNGGLLQLQQVLLPSPLPFLSLSVQPISYSSQCTLAPHLKSARCSRDPLLILWKQTMIPAKGQQRQCNPKSKRQINGGGNMWPPSKKQPLALICLTLPPNRTPTSKTRNPHTGFLQFQTWFK